MNHADDMQKYTLRVPRNTCPSGADVLCTSRYSDMMDLPHHTSSKRPRMPVADRAAQFSPFAALGGYDAAIQETGRYTGERIELDENSKAILDEKLRLLMEQMPERPEITITYFQPDDKKEGGMYVEVTGYVKKLDPYGKMIVMGDGTQIGIEQILDISGEVVRGSF